MTEKTNMIEAYLMGNLSGTQKADFEKAMANDPAFHQEVRLQEDIISSLKSQRALELKSRLQGIEVSSGYQYGTMAKIAASISAALLVGIGTYYYLADTPEEPTEITITAPEPSAPAAQEEMPAEEKAPLSMEPATESTLEIEEDQPAFNTHENAKAPKAVAPEKERTTASRSLGIPELDTKTPADENILLDPESGDIPLDGINQSNDVSSRFVTSDIDIRESSSDFHYKFKNGSLILYGNFTNPKPCVLEFKLNNTTNHYLYYDKDVYKLSEASQKTALKAIEDKDLKKRLKKAFDGCQPIEN